MSRSDSTDQDDDGLTFTSHSEFLAHAQPDPSPEPLLTAASPDLSCLQVSVPQPSSSNLNGCGVFNNYLFRQDPATGHLSLVPVQVRAPDSLLGLDIDLSLLPQPLQGLMAPPQDSGAAFISCLDVEATPQDDAPASLHHRSGCIRSSSPSELSTPRGTSPGSQGEDQGPGSRVLPALQDVIQLLRGQFSLDGDSDGGQEDVTMGMYLV